MSFIHISPISIFSQLQLFFPEIQRLKLGLPSGHDIKARLVHTLSKDGVLGFLSVTAPDWFCDTWGFQNCLL